ncbi:hypothetical protein HWV62_7021 [Athelia sp. TMB]|nr:hypothetical protein HWV62_7021 [Athelia sp. TMB]
MVFCSQCGAQGEGRFCAQCGSPLVSHSSSQSSLGDPPAMASGSRPGPYTQGSSGAVPSRPAQPPPPPESFTALIGSQGQLMPAFHHIASEIFIKLDQTYEPKGSRGLEPNKITQFKKLGGKKIPPYFESHVLPVYYDIIGAERVPGLPTAVLTWDGWHTYLQHKVLAMPADTFTHLVAVLAQLRIQLPHPLKRGDLPLHPHPEAAAREEKFQVDIRQLASMAMQVRTARTNAMAGILRQGAMNIQMAAAPPRSLLPRHHINIFIHHHIIINASFSTIHVFQSVLLNFQKNVHPSRSPAFHLLVALTLR